MTCAFVDCSQATACGLVGGCRRKRPDWHAGDATREQSGRYAEVGTKARQARDPRRIRRQRKEIWRGSARFDRGRR